MEEYGVGVDHNPHQQRKHQKMWRNNNNQRKDKNKDLPSTIVEVKPLLIGIHERVRIDIAAHEPPPSVSSTIEEGGKGVLTATNPSVEDVAKLLRICLQYRVPNTFSSTYGLVYPICGDRPPNDTSNESKKKGSIIKDKEKGKTMKGQSSHATWKSETEMQLRQQFD
ncbi:hypothetical protein POTOM_005157 [Populus tomentosa]|uniref:Uncharacterized protein n=1 Tax=Populus tomentosa TaxID=118781 RepID=A0A8X8AGI7_POPTO|nr:hypothetical protein POTOM_005157 [Populus tomentosa]